MSRPHIAEAIVGFLMRYGTFDLNFHTCLFLSRKSLPFRGIAVSHLEGMSDSLTTWNEIFGGTGEVRPQHNSARRSLRVQRNSIDLASQPENSPHRDCCSGPKRQKAFVGVAFPAYIFHPHFPVRPAHNFDFLFQMASALGGGTYLRDTIGPSKGRQVYSKFTVSHSCRLAHTLLADEMTAEVS